MRSASKSVISLLVGIAIDRKLIAGADEPVVKFFPEYAAVKSPGWDHITLRHLLTMSSGMQWDENRAWNDPEERRTASRQRSRPDPLHPVEADRRAAGHGVGLQWRRDRPARQHPRTRVGQAAGSVRARNAVRAARHYRFGMEELSEERKGRRRRRPPHASARCRENRPARARTAASGPAGRSSRRNGSSNRSGRASRRSAISAGCSFMASNGGWGARFRATAK